MTSFEDHALDIIVSYHTSPFENKKPSNSSENVDPSTIQGCLKLTPIPLVSLLGVLPSQSSWTLKMLKDCIFYRYFQFLLDNLSKPEEHIGDLFEVWREYLTSNVDISDTSSDYFKLTNLVILEVEHLLTPDVISIFSSAPETYCISYSGNMEKISFDSTLKNMLDELRVKSTKSLKPKLSKLYLEVKLEDLCHLTPVRVNQQSFNMHCDLEGFKSHTDIRGKQYIQYIFKIYIDNNDPYNNSNNSWIVKKRYTDFEMLHDNLTRSSSDKDSYDYFDVSILPSLPSKYSNSGPEHRKVIFLNYMQVLVKAIDLYPIKSVLNFLGLLNDSLLSAESNSISESIALNNRTVLHASRLNAELETGDLVLFKCKNNFSQMQRTITGSEWDHVGIIVRVTNASYIRMKDILSSENAKKTLSNRFGSSPGVQPIESLLVSIKKTLSTLVGSDKTNLRASESSNTCNITLKTRINNIATGFECCLPGGIRTSGGSKQSSIVCILECTGEGVTILPLQQRIKAYDFYDCCHYMAVRRLNIPDNLSWEKVCDELYEAENSAIHGKRTNYDLAKLSSFLTTVVGLPYSFRVASIAASFIVSSKTSSTTSDSTKVNNNNSSDNENGSNNTISPDTEKVDESNSIIQPAYFCSELIAAMLKSLKIIPCTIKNDLFWPGSFASGDIMDKIIYPSYSYGSEIIIDCRVNDISDIKETQNPLPKVESNSDNSNAPSIMYKPPVFDHHLLAIISEKDSSGATKSKIKSPDENP